MNAEEYARRQREQAIASNDGWKLRNIDNHLRPYVEFCRQANIIGASKSLHEYAG